MHIPPFDNNNKPLVDIDDKHVPLNYFNIVKLNKDQSFEYITPGYETCIVPATGTINVNVEGYEVNNLGTRTIDVWDGEPEGVYVPSGVKTSFVAINDSEIFIAGAKLAIGSWKIIETLPPLIFFKSCFDVNFKTFSLSKIISASSL